MKKLTPEQLAELEERIRELVPGSRDLSFGCEVVISFPEIEKDLQPAFGKGIYLGELDGLHSVITYGLVHRVEERQISEVIGHPITLEHCNIAIKRWRDAAYDTDEYILPRHILRNELSCSWRDLEPWEEQHDVHRFLYDYLCKK